MIQVAWILCSKLFYGLPVKLELVGSVSQICYFFIIYKMGVIFVLLILQHLVKIKWKNECENIFKSMNHHTSKKEEEELYFKDV